MYLNVNRGSGFWGQQRAAEQRDVPSPVVEDGDGGIGSRTCAGVSSVPDVIHLICQNIAFTDLTHRY